MHDSVNQSIHSLMLFSETLISLLRKNQFSEAISVAERVHDSGRQALKEIRLLLFETQSPSAEEITDLVAALKERFNFVENRVGVQADISLDGTLAHVPAKWNGNLFWIAIEALNNALKHARADKVRILFRFHNRRFEMEIIDKGAGFDPALLDDGGMGMHTMQERAELLGGQLSVTSSPGHGTKVLFCAEIKE
jgi:signal transduction histidine kinase